MLKALSLGCLVAALATMACADQLVLKDGRAFTGVVTVRDDVVEIQLPHSTLHFPRDDVSSIELKDTPEIELSKKLEKISPTDVDGLLAAAKWAGENALGRQANDVYAKVLLISPDQATARREMGYVKIDGQWRDFDAAVQLARGKLEAGQYDVLLNAILPSLEEVAAKRQKASLVKELIGQTQLRAKEFGDAAKTYEELAAKTEGVTGLRVAAIADVLKDNPDGMYVLTEQYPPASPLLEESTSSIKPGPASLSDPMVLEAALRDRAKKEIKAGRELLEAAQQAGPSDPDAAKVKYFQASKSLDRADALVEGIAHSYRIEIARRRIADLRKEVDAEANKFDAAMAKLGKQEVTPAAYREMINKLIHSIDSVRDNLKTVLSIAKPYPRDLVMEITWAQADLKKIESMREILLAEIDAEK